MRRCIKYFMAAAAVPAVALAAAACSSLKDLPVTEDKASEALTSATSAADTEPSISGTSDDMWGFIPQYSDNGEESGTSKDNSLPKSGIPLMQDAIEDYCRSAIDFLSEQKFTIGSAQPFMLMSDKDDINKEIQIGEVVVNNGLLSFNVLTRIEELVPEYETDYETILVLQVNGKICDFTYDGQKSEGGMLRFKTRTNTDYAGLFEAKDVPIRKGKNSFTLIEFYYNPKLNTYLHDMCIPCTFVSDKDYEGKTVKCTPEKKIGKITTITDEDDVSKDDIYYTRMITDKDYINFDVDDSDMEIFTLRPDPDLHYFIINDNDDKGPSNRGGLLFMLDNGELLPVWGGNNFGEVSLTDKILRKEITIPTDLKSDKEHSIYWGYIETYNDKLDCYTHTEDFKIVIGG